MNLVSGSFAGLGLSDGLGSASSWCESPRSFAGLGLSDGFSSAGSWCKSSLCDTGLRSNCLGGAGLRLSDGFGGACSGCKSSLCDAGLGSDRLCGTGVDGLGCARLWLSGSLSDACGDGFGGLCCGLGHAACWCAGRALAMIIDERVKEAYVARRSTYPSPTTTPILALTGELYTVEANANSAYEKITCPRILKFWDSN